MNNNSENNREENEVLDEKLFSLIKIILKSKPKATVRDVCNRIRMAREGSLYTKADIEKCINIAIKNGLLITDENGEVKQADDTSAKNIERINFANELKVQKDELAAIVRHNSQQKDTKSVGYFTRKDRDR